MNPRRLHELTIFSILAAPKLGEGGRCGSVLSLISRHCSRRPVGDARSNVFSLGRRLQKNYFSTVTFVFTEFAMKHSVCAKWCMSSSSCSVGCFSPENFIFGCNSTLVIAILPVSFFSM